MAGWIFRGHKQESKQLKKTLEKYCLRCGTWTPHSTMVKYEYDHMQFILTWVTDSEIKLTCLNCGNTQILPEEEEQRYFPTSPVPWTKEYSIFIFIGIFIVLIAGGLILQSPMICVPIGIVLIVFIFLAMLQK
jgi:hypothetical protein